MSMRLSPKGTFPNPEESFQRKHAEIRRRLLSLHFRRNRLKKELNEVNSALILLDKQISREMTFE